MELSTSRSERAEAPVTRLLRLVARVRPGIISLALLSVVFVTLQRGVFPHEHTTFPIFRQAYHHLVAGKDLYAAYPDEQGALLQDRFKYSPTAALLLGPFAVPPLPVGLLLWNLLNAALLFLALDALLTRRAATLAMVLVFPSLFHAVQSSSSNALVAALIVFTFVALERGRQLTGALVVGLATLIKIFPIVAVTFAVCRPRRARFAAAVLISLAGLAALPLLVSSSHGLTAQYESWRTIVTGDELDLAFGLSIMRAIRTFVGTGMPNWPLQLAGSTLLFLPLLLNRPQWEHTDFRRRFLCSLLVYAVIFNHQAEHQSFVIAATGLAVWYATSRRSAWRTALVFVCLVGFESWGYAFVWCAMQAELLLSPELQKVWASKLRAVVDRRLVALPQLGREVLPSVVLLAAASPAEGERP